MTTDNEQRGFDQGAMAVALDSLTDVEREALLAQIEAAAQAKADRMMALDRDLDALEGILLKMRDDAITARAESGIELEWAEDTEFYEGIDDANRHEHARYQTRKPANGGTITQKVTVEQSGSTVFLNITGPYVDNAAAKAADMMMPHDDRNFSIDPSPIPDLPGQKPTDDSSQTGDAADASPYAQALEGIRKEATRRAKNAQTRIDDWLTDCNYQKHLRRVMNQAAKLGCGVMKGPFPMAERKRVRWKDVQAATQVGAPVAMGTAASIVKDVVTWFARKQQQDRPGSVTVGAMMLEQFAEVVPGSKFVNVWDFFPDGGCGENIHNGSSCWERDRLSKKMVADLATPAVPTPDDPEPMRNAMGYYPHRVRAVYEQGPTAPRYTSQYNQDDLQAIKEGRRFETWYGYCFLEREHLETVGIQFDDDTIVQVPVLVQFINERLVKIALNPLSKGDFPYDVLRWSERDGYWFGTGVARKIRVPQRMVNAATRTLMDNAGVAAGVILAIMDGLVPMDGTWRLHNRKIFKVKEGSDIKRAEDAISAVDVPMRVAEIMQIIEFGLRMAEQVTNLPLLLQGHQGRAPDTLGVAEIMNNNANTFLRSIAKRVDDDMTEPHITRYCDWIQEYSENDDERGDFKPDARGSSSLVDRELQNQWIAQMAAYVKDPAFKINPAKWFEEFSKSVRFDPKRMQYSDEEWQEIQNQPPPTPYQVDVAKINAEARLQAEEVRAAAKREADVMRILADESISASDLKARLLDIVTKDRRERDLFVAQRAVKDQHGESVDMPG